MRQVEQEVDEAPTGGRQVCPTEKHTDEEALHDGGHAEDQQEDEDHGRVAVTQHLPVLVRKQEVRQVKGDFCTLSEQKALPKSYKSYTGRNGEKKCLHTFVQGEDFLQLKFSTSWQKPTL